MKDGADIVNLDAASAAEVRALIEELEADQFPLRKRRVMLGGMAIEISDKKMALDLLRQAEAAGPGRVSFNGTIGLD
ncbi:MAG: hypothetical protein J5J06_17850 [Phycisphaerae bacterium]|nr:hypothetical protein [Phycisphaerae bacterium]